MTTGPRVGSSSVAWVTPAGVITSTAFGTVSGLAEQTGAVPPGAHTPKVKPPGVAVKFRAWSVTWAPSRADRCDRRVAVGRRVDVGEGPAGPGVPALGSRARGRARPGTSSNAPATPGFSQAAPCEQVPGQVPGGAVAYRTQPQPREQQHQRPPQ